MRKLFRPIPILIAVAVLVVGASAGWFFTTGHRPTTKLTATHTSSSKTSKKSMYSTSNSVNSGDASATSTNTSAADKAIANESSSQAISNACKLLTLNTAKQVIGPGAQSVIASDTTSYQANDTSLTSCAYADGNNTAQLVIRTASGSLGSSENATEFGSGRPSSAVTIKGLGQSAYWDPVQHTLNVLGNNNWYIITRNTNTQADTEKLANLLTAGF